jgi:hypothetical protein
MVGKYTADEWRARAYSVRYFVGFTAAGVAVGLIAALHDKGGFALTLKAFAALCVFIIVAALVFPPELRKQELAAQPAE